MVKQRHLFARTRSSFLNNKCIPFECNYYCWYYLFLYVVRHTWSTKICRICSTHILTLLQWCRSVWSVHSDITVGCDYSGNRLLTRFDGPAVKTHSWCFSIYFSFFRLLLADMTTVQPIKTNKTSQYQTKVCNRLTGPQCQCRVLPDPCLTIRWGNSLCRFGENAALPSHKYFV